jgi:hypothetical protein
MPQRQEKARQFVHRPWQLLAPTHRSRHCTDSVCYLRDFCRADEASGMPLHDPKEKLTVVTFDIRGPVPWPEAIAIQAEG